MTIEEIVRSKLIFHVNKSSGWNTLYCEVCGDGARAKGPRGAWKFDDTTASYNCFNCGISGSFDPDREFPYSKEMKKIFSSFDLDLLEIDKLIANKILAGEKYNAPKKLSFDLKFFDIPDHFYKLSSVDEEKNIIALRAKAFLEIEKKIDPSSYDFYLSTGVTKSNDVREQAIAKTLINRLIIPAYKSGKMIYYEARALGDQKQKYINLDVPKSNIIYGYDKLFRDYEKPLYITEGFFDAHHLDGIAVLGNKLSKSQIEVITKSPRRKIVVPDKKIDKTKNDDGNKLANQAIELGWEIAFPDIGNCIDVTEAIVKYGKLHVFNSINSTICRDFMAKVNLNLW